MSRATRAINSSRSTAIMTPIISPAISPVEMADWEEATLTAGEEERVVRGGEEGVVPGGEASVVVVVMVTVAQSGADRLSSAVEHIGSI